MKATREESLTFGALTILAWALFVGAVVAEDHYDGWRADAAREATADAMWILRRLP